MRKKNKSSIQSKQPQERVLPRVRIDQEEPGSFPLLVYSDFQYLSLSVNSLAEKDLQSPPTLISQACDGSRYSSSQGALH